MQKGNRDLGALALHGLRMMSQTRMLFLSVDLPIETNRLNFFWCSFIQNGQKEINYKVIKQGRDIEQYNFRILYSIVCHIGGGGGASKSNTRDDAMTQVYSWSWTKYYNTHLRLVSRESKFEIAMTNCNCDIWITECTYERENFAEFAV